MEELETTALGLGALQFRGAWMHFEPHIADTAIPTDHQYLDRSHPRTEIPPLVLTLDIRVILLYTSIKVL